MSETEKMRESAKIDYAVAGCGPATEAVETHGAAAIRLTFASARRRVTRLLDEAERTYRQSAVRPPAVAFSVTGPSADDVQALSEALEVAERRGQRAGRVTGALAEREAVAHRAQVEAEAKKIASAVKLPAKKKARRR